MNLLKRYRPGYLLPRIARRVLPEQVALRFLSKRHKSDDLIYAGSQRYYRLIELARQWDPQFHLRGATLLEAGTGVYNPTAAPLLLGGVERFILLEPYLGGMLDLPRFNARHAALLHLAETDAGFPLPRAAGAAQWLAAAPDVWPSRVEWLERLWEETGLAAESVDCVCSISVLEHLRAPEAIIAESARVLRAGGWMLNLVDMRDHYFKYPFEMLKYSPGQWRLLTTRAGGAGYLNRWRLGDWLQALERHGFETRVLELEVDDVGLACERTCFAAEFRHRPDSELRVLQAGLVSRRR